MSTNNTAATDFEYNKIGNITYFGNNTPYNYVTRHSGCGAQPPHAQPQAVKQIGNNYYCYDNNGNMSKRVEGGVTYTQNFNVENELSSVAISGQTTSFTYDAAGIRVKTVHPGGKTSYYPFPGYEEEVNGSTTTRRVTYAVAGQTVALRVQVVGSSNNTLYYLHSDHLGSTSLATTTAGAVVSCSTSRYHPFGSFRTTPTAGLTDVGFTGHRHNNLGAGDLGLVYMGARFYLPYINQFWHRPAAKPDSRSTRFYATLSP